MTPDRHEPGPDLVGAGQAGRILGLSSIEIDRLTRTTPFPTHVAWVRENRAWLRSDIEAYRDGLFWPERTAEELQPNVLSLPDVAEQLGCGLNTARSRLYRQSWQLFPRPSGRVANARYWWRPNLERWQRDQQTKFEQRKGPTKTRLANCARRGSDRPINWNRR